MADEHIPTRYDQPLAYQGVSTPPRYVGVASEDGSTVVSCSVCASLVLGARGEAQHTEYHRLLANALTSSSGRFVPARHRIPE